MKLKVAYSGVPGCFAEEAAVRYYAGLDGVERWQDVCELVPTGSFAAAFQAVADGKADRAVLPIENSLAGSVNSVYDQMISHNFYIVRSARIKHALRAGLNALAGLGRD